MDEQTRPAETAATHAHPWAATSPKRSRWQTLFLLLTATLSSTIVLKFASIQYLEYVYLIQMGVLLVAFAQRDYVVVWFRPFLRIAVCYVLFCIAALALAVAALRLDFYLPTGIGSIFLRRPVVISISRLAELVASVSMMIYLAHLFRRDPDKTRFTMRAYFWTGFASAVYSFLSWPLNVAGIASLGVYLSTHRFRGFSNEGGPYGLYLVSVAMVGFALYRQRWEPKRRLLWTAPVLAGAFLMSSSKAAVLMVAFLFILNGLLARSAAQRATIICVAGVAVAVAAHVTNFAEGVRIYRSQSVAYERLSYLHAQDPNYILGRIAGAYIVPRMIAAHPWTGIGLGNYGLMRNAPEFRGAAAWADADDLPGLGFISLAPELGLPLFFYAFFCLILPFLIVRRMRAPAYLQSLALIQPMEHLCGAQLNVTYPWIVTAFALGLASMHRPHRTPVADVPEREAPGSLGALIPLTEGSNG